MKKLILINGPMGVGKSSTCEKLYKKIEKSIWLDGDWCWIMNPWIENEETIRMVQDNILYLLKNYLSSTIFENIILSTSNDFSRYINKLNEKEFSLFNISLICSEREIERRLSERGEALYIEKSKKQIHFFKSINTIKIDNSKISIDDTVNEIMRII